MNIAFDAVAILGPMSKNRGIGNYATAQFREMIARDPDNQYFFFNVFEPYSLGNYENLTEEYFDCGKDRGLLSVADGIVYENLIRRFIQKHKIDVFYITSPFDDRVPVYRKEWFADTQTAITVYDIIPYVLKDHYFGGTPAQWYMERLEQLNWVDKMLVISQSVKDDLMKYLDFSGENIEVIWGASSDMFRKIEISQKDEARLRKKFGVKNDFIMCTGGDDERKNLAGLIEAYAGLPKKTTDQYSLVIVCKLQEASMKRYTELAQKLSVGEKVILTNFVTDEELIQFYNLASLVAFPSKYEGFGLPVVEAWACHTPVLTSNNSSLVQIAGDAAITVDPFDTADVTRGLAEALQPEMLKEMTERGLKRLEMFRWPAVADSVIEQINQMRRPESAQQKALPRLAFFTPLPPQQSGIADYSADVLSALASRFKIDVYIDDGYTPDDLFADQISIYPHTEFSARVKEYDHILYQMGNSMFHYYMYPYLRQYGGTLVLHDYNMHGVAQYVALHICNDNLETYRGYLLEDYSADIVQQYLQGIRNGKSVQISMELNGFVTNYANKIIVHSEYAREKLLEHDIGRRVAKIPLYAKIEPLVPVETAKRALGIPEKNLVYSTFGHIHETKRAIPLLKAGIRLLKEQRNAELYFVGKLDAGIEEEFQTICEKSGVSDRIHVTGYVDLDEFCKYIDASDVCFNLRYPYNGENSGSVARILAKGKCVVVNDVGSFGEIPDACCIKLPPVESMSNRQEENAIYRSMKELAGNRKGRARLGREARKYAEEVLDLQRIAEQYASFITQKQVGTITEDVLDMIREYEIEAKNYTEQEVRGIAKTLAYCVEQ